MLPNYIKELLGLEDVFITKTIHADNYVIFHVKTKPKEHVCPKCESATSRVHDYRQQKIKDLPFQLKQAYLVLHKRRYVCPCGKRFFEDYSFLARYQQRTKRLTHAVVNEGFKTQSIKSIAERVNLSSHTVSRILSYISFSQVKLGETLALDEFKGNAGTEKFQCILTDPKKRRIIDILHSRSYGTLADYFSKIHRTERYKVKYFICDMWQPFVDIADKYFPNAKVIIDKYHFIRQTTWAIESVRKQAQKTMTADLRKHFKRSRKLILTRYHKLTEEHKLACNNLLGYHDDLRRAHWLKEKFYEVCQNPKYSEQRKDFWDWIKFAETSGLPAFEKCARTYRNWSKEILNAFKYGYTNGFTEGCNNKIKVIKRISYGVRNFKLFRTRIMLASMQ